MSNVPPICDDSDDPLDGTYPEPAMRWFAFTRLRPEMQQAGILFHQLASYIAENIGPGAERTAAISRLLESRDAAMRGLFVKLEGQMESRDAAMGALLAKLEGGDATSGA